MARRSTLFPLAAATFGPIGRLRRYRTLVDCIGTLTEDPTNASMWAMVDMVLGDLVASDPPQSDLLERAIGEVWASHGMPGLALLRSLVESAFTTVPTGEVPARRRGAQPIPIKARLYGVPVSPQEAGTPFPNRLSDVAVHTLSEAFLESGIVRDVQIVLLPALMPAERFGRYDWLDGEALVSDLASAALSNADMPGLEPERGDEERPEDALMPETAIMVFAVIQRASDPDAFERPGESQQDRLERFVPWQTSFGLALARATGRSVRIGPWPLPFFEAVRAAATSERERTLRRMVSEMKSRPSRHGSSTGVVRARVMELANEMGPVVAVQVFRAGAPHPEAMNESELDDEGGNSSDGQRIEGCAVEIAPMQCETPIEVAATAAAELERLGAVLIGRDD
jgi:hypothetical protein